MYEFLADRMFRLFYEMSLYMTLLYFG